MTSAYYAILWLATEGDIFTGAANDLARRQHRTPQDGTTTGITIVAVIALLTLAPAIAGGLRYITNKAGGGGDTIVSRTTTVCGAAPAAATRRVAATTTTETTESGIKGCWPRAIVTAAVAIVALLYLAPLILENPWGRVAEEVTAVFLGAAVAIVFFWVYKDNTTKSLLFGTLLGFLTVVVARQFYLEAKLDAPAPGTRFGDVMVAPLQPPPVATPLRQGRGSERSTTSTGVQEITISVKNPTPGGRFVWDGDKPNGPDKIGICEFQVVTYPTRERPVRFYYAEALPRELVYHRGLDYTLVVRTRTYTRRTGPEGRGYYIGERRVPVSEIPEEGSRTIAPVGSQQGMVVSHNALRQVETRRECEALNID